MDKNFVNIDDLVRQRLGGGEEQERSGAWLRMSELLDKEMPRDKFGMLYWRRMLGAVSALLLIAAVSVGGYELSSYRAGNNNTVAALSPAATTPSSIAPAKDNNGVSNEVTNQLSSTGNTDNDNENVERKTADHKQHSKTLAANTTHNNKDANKEIAAANNKTGSDNSTDKKELQATDNHKVDDAKLTGKENKKVAAKETVPAKNLADKSVAAKDKEIAAKATVTKTPANDVSKATQAKPGTVALANNDKKATHKAEKSKTGTDKPKDESMSSLALNGKATIVTKAMPDATKGDIVPTPPAKADKKSDVAKLALNNHAPAAKGITASKVANVKADKVADPKNTLSKDNKTASAKTEVASAGKAGNTAAINSPAKPATSPVAAKPAVDNKAMKEVTAINMKKGKKMVQKLVLLERYIKITPTEGYYHIDTISMEEFTEEMGIANENKPYLPKSAAARNAKTAGVASANETNDNSATVNPQILPGATASATGKPAMGTKQSTAGSKSAGASALENLSAKFNDIKYQAAGVQFAPGLAAGINSTFFGPTSFSGFQFGFTGNFIFSSTWSIASALEYFHRINGNYSMDDNYYNYTQTAGGWNKQQESYSYSFSTLHSLEMPIAARYTSGNFSFSVGANLVYNFAINTGRAPDPSGSTQFVTVQANDQSPKLNQADFNARFGLGCLFGVSYQVAPNVTLDLRNVQTLWDNSKTSSAKYVSDQLYKSPSLQFSVGYRLGGNKNKDK